MTRTQLVVSRREFIGSLSAIVALRLSCRAGRPTEPGSGPSGLEARPGSKRRTRFSRRS